MIGQTISHYKILEKIGAGGMGVVYKAEDVKLKRTVALKFLPPELTRDREAKKRFLHEARAASALDHPNICTVHEIDETQDGRMFIAMGYYEGRTLKDKIAERPLPVNDTIGIALQIAEGLNRAHRKDIIHRDIKAANIMITDEGVVKILDFGLAKLRGATKLTQEGTTMGTVAYMSPEQASGEAVDHRSDIWSLGVILYEMVTGQLPFKGEYEQATMYAIMNEDPQPVTGLRSGIPPELERISDKLLTKDPAQRYQHLDDVIVDLKGLHRSLSGSEPDAEPTLKIGGRRPKRAILIPGLLLLIAVIAAGYFILKDTGSAAEPVVEKDSGQQSVAATRWKNSIAVLPFANISADPEQEYFCDGMTEDIITKLAHINDLKVISRTSVMAYKQTEKTIRQIGRELAVDNILEGSVRKAKDRIRITAQLIRVADDAHLWANKYDRNLESIFEVQDEVSRAIARALKVTLTPENIRAYKAGQTENLEAYEYYMKGMHLFNVKYLRTFNEVDFNSAVTLLKKALEIDPEYLGAHASLVWLHVNHYIFKNDESDFDLFVEYAEKLKRMAPESAEAYGNMAMVFLLRGRYDQAYEYLKLATARAPSSALLNYGVGYFYLQVGLFQHAVKFCMRAMELDPLFLHSYATTIRSFLYMGEYLEAENYLKKASEIFSDHPLILNFYCNLHLRRGNYHEAEKSLIRLEEVLSNYKNIPAWRALAYKEYWMILHAARGERDQALALDYPSSAAFALLGMKDEALAILQKALDQNKYTFRYLRLINSPHYENLRTDPRFQQIVAEAKSQYEERVRKYGDL